jgi:16S rRNA (guanine527-N7)-methyltransferase
MSNHWDQLKTTTQLRDDQLLTFQKLWSFYSREMKTMNFTSIKNEDEFVVKHFIDSIFPFVETYGEDVSGKLLDIGTGGGFPGVPLQIKYPNLKVDLLDGTKKKTEMLELLRQEFSLNCGVINARAEVLAHEDDFRESYDFVSNRAFAQWPIILELGLPFLKIGGVMACYQGPQTAWAIHEFEDVLSLLGAKILAIKQFDLPLEMGIRFVVLLSKIKKTPDKFPRSMQKIKANPLA